MGLVLPGIPRRKSTPRHSACGGPGTPNGAPRVRGRPRWNRVEMQLIDNPPATPSPAAPLSFPPERAVGLTFIEPTYAVTNPLTHSGYGGQRRQEMSPYWDAEEYLGRPKAPLLVKVTSKKGGLFVQFLPSPSAEKYEVTVTSDKAGDSVLRREIWEGNSNVNGFVGVGDLSTTAYVRVRAITGRNASVSTGLGPCGQAVISGTVTSISGAPDTIPSPIVPGLGDETSSGAADVSSGRRSPIFGGE